MIRIIREKATKQELQEMMEMLQTYVKLAVDVERGVLAGGGAMHADCEAILLDDGSKQDFIWGADWSPETQEVTFESLINIRPRQNNRSLELQDPELRARVERITRKLLGGV
jgi:hypothetical protein